MDNKLIELKDALEFLETTEFDGEWDSALVGGENGKNYHAVINANDVVVRAADDSRHTSWLCDYLEAVSPLNMRALLAELEAKDKRIAELEEEFSFIMGQNDGMEKELRDKDERIEHLEAKLATPVRLPRRAPENFASVLDGYEKWLIATTFRDTWNACLDEVSRVSSGFTVEGDE